MTSQDITSLSYKMSRSGLEDRYTKYKGRVTNERKIPDVGCCGDVPKSHKRSRLLEWLKSSQVKREENNKQVFSRWIEQVENGTIDVMSSRYPGKGNVKLNSTDNMNADDQCILTSNATCSEGVTTSAESISHQAFVASPGYYPTNYYSNTAIYAPIQMPAQSNVNIFQPNYQPYIVTPNTQIINNYCQYIPVPQSCGLYPQYIMAPQGTLINDSTSQVYQVPYGYPTSNLEQVNNNNGADQEVPQTEIDGVNTEGNEYNELSDEIKVDDKHDEQTIKTITENN